MRHCRSLSPQEHQTLPDAAPTIQYSKLKSTGQWAVRIVGTPEQVPAVGDHIVVDVERSSGDPQTEQVRCVWLGEATYEAGQPLPPGSGKQTALCEIISSDQPAAQPDPASPVWAGRATYSKLRDETWGVRMEGASVPPKGTTATVTVTKKSGDTKVETVTILWCGPHNTDATTQVALGRIRQ